MRRILILLLLLAAGLTMATAQDVIKVMSYNVRQSFATNDGHNHWRYRRHASKNMLIQEHPALVGMQETCPDQVAYFDEALKDYGRLGVGRDDGKQEGEMMAIYYDRALFDLVDWGTFWLSATPDTVSQGWDGACKRTCTWACLTYRPNGQRVLFLNTHLDHIGREARREGVRLIAQRITALRQRFTPQGEHMPVFLTADFNTSSVNPIFDVLKQQMHEARATARIADTGYTFNEWGRVKQQLEANGCDPHNIKLGATGNSDNEPVIDHIFFSGAQPLEFSVLRGDYGAPYISDHYPVMLEARLWRRHLPQRILTIGNSYTADAVEQYLWNIAHEHGIDLTIGSLVTTDGTLLDHARFFRNGEARYDYRRIINGKLRNYKNTTLATALADDDWDVVALQQSPERAGRPDSYEPALTELLDSVEHNTGAALAWQMTWPYARDAKATDFDFHSRSQRKMYADILDATDQLTARRYFDYLIPTGTAIQLVRDQFAAGNGTAATTSDALTRDGLHLSDRAGRYAAALTWAETLLGIDARNVTFTPHGLAPDQADVIRAQVHAAAQGKQALK